MNGADPLRTGRIFGLDPNLLKRMRPQATLNKPQVQSPPPLESFTREELIPGLKAKFDDVFRSTPNPMTALFSSSQSYLSAHISPASSAATFSSFPSSRLSTPKTPPTTPLLNQSPAPMVPIEEDLSEFSEQSPPVVAAKKSKLAPEQHSTDRLPGEPLPLPPSFPASPPRPPPSPPKRLSKPPKETPRTEEKRPMERTYTCSAPDDRQAKSEGKKPRPRPRQQGVCDSLSLLFAPSASSQTKPAKTAVATMESEALSSSHRIRRPLSPTATEQTRFKNSKSSIETEVRASSSVQQRLFFSPTRSPTQHQSPATTATPDKISKRTRSRTKPVQRSILSQLPTAATTAVASASIAVAGSPPSMSFRTSLSQSDVKSQANPSKGRSQRKSNGQRKGLGSKSRVTTHSQEEKPKKAPAIGRAKQQPTAAVAPNSSAQSRPKKRKQSISDAESEGEGGSEGEGQREGRRRWSKEEIDALRRAHRESPIDAPNFWELVATRLQESLGPSRQRSQEECQDQWYQALSARNDRKKRKSPASTSVSGPQRNSSEETALQKPKRRTQAQLRSLLEEAFVGKADDLFESRSLSTAHHSLASASTPHRDPLRAPSLHSIFAVKSPLDLQPRPHDRRTSSSSLDSSADIGAAAPTTHWEASYVNKMKKQQRSNAAAVGKTKVQTAGKRVSSLGKASSEFTGRRVEASLNGHGRVTISVRHRDDDDSENEEQIRELVANQCGHSDEEEEEEEQEWHGER